MPGLNSRQRRRVDLPGPRKGVQPAHMPKRRADVADASLLHHVSHLLIGDPVDERLRHAVRGGLVRALADVHLADVPREVRAAREVRPHRREEVPRAENAVLGVPGGDHGTARAAYQRKRYEVSVLEI